MENIIILLICIFCIIISKFIFKFNLKKAKQLSNDERLNQLTQDLPDNIEVCKQILKNINNEKVEVQETIDKKSGTSLYIAISNKILIANLKESFVRFQTIAHECRHSIQNRTMQISQFILANLYKISFILILVLQLIYKNINLYLILGSVGILGISYQVVKYILEKDAIINSRQLALDYLKENSSIEENVLRQIDEKYLYINKMGVNFIAFTCIVDILIRICIITIMW